MGKSEAEARRLMYRGSVIRHICRGMSSLELRTPETRVTSWTAYMTVALGLCSARIVKKPYNRAAQPQDCHKASFTFHRQGSPIDKALPQARLSNTQGVPIDKAFPQAGLSRCPRPTAMSRNKPMCRMCPWTSLHEAFGESCLSRRAGNNCNICMSRWTYMA